jgi:hypothetical protein
LPAAASAAPEARDAQLQPTSVRRRLLPILLLAVACASVVQISGWNERSHYAQVRAFAAGTARIDPYVADTGDRGFFRGHYYSDKAPGLALLTSPVYSVAKSAGYSASDENHEIHLLSIFGSLLPAAVVLLLVAGFVDRLEPPLGVASALLLGFGSLLLPFSTLFFSHVLSACLGFAAYYVLWLGRRGNEDPLLIGAAGVLAGLAVSTEYPLAILAVLLAAFALGRPPRPRRLAAYAAGGVLGLVPLLAYNLWAFGSLTHISYASVQANQAGVFGLTGFSPSALVSLLFGSRGLLTLTPVLALGVGGIVLLYREGRRGEAVMAGAVVLAYVAYNASYYLPYGGWVPGPRFLIPVIPFLGLPLAAALRRVPLLTLTLGAVSGAMMIAATITRPELPSNLPTSAWWERLLHGQFPTAGAGGQVLWFAVFAGAAVLTAARFTSWPSGGRVDVGWAAAGLVLWILIASVSGTLGLAHASVLAAVCGAAVLGAGAVAGLWRTSAGRRLIGA